MAISFDSNVQISVTFAAEVDRFDGFSTVVLITENLAADPALIDGDRYRVYTSAASVDADVALGNGAGGGIDAALGAQIKVAFEQDRAPRQVILAQYDSTGGGADEDPGDVIDALDADGVDFYGVALLAGAADEFGDILALAAKIAARRGGTQPKYAIAAAASGAATILDGTALEASGGLETIATRNDISVQYHDGTGTGAALGFARLVARLGYDPDLGSAGFEGAVRGIEAYATDPSDTERAAMEAVNVELYGTFGSTPYISPGTALSGRPLAEQVTADWFAIRFAEDIRDLKLARDAAGEVFPLSPEGQEIIQSAFAIRRLRGEAIGRLAPGESVLNLPNPIPPEDISAERFSGSGRLVVLRGGRIFDFDFTAST